MEATALQVEAKLASYMLASSMLGLQLLHEEKDCDG